MLSFTATSSPVSGPLGALLAWESAVASSNAVQCRYRVCDRIRAKRAMTDWVRSSTVGSNWVDAGAGRGGWTTNEQAPAAKMATVLR